MNAKMLRGLRIALEAVALAIATGLFTSYAMTFPRMAQWLARIQLLPATLSFTLAVLVGWLIITLMFGRVYCSTVCPMGAFQDVMARLPRIRRKWRLKHQYHYHNPHTRLRLITLTVVAVCLAFGFTIIPLLLDPYSAFGRMALNIAKPIWGIILTYIGQPAVKVGIASMLGFGVALVTAVAIGWIATRNGRTYCNSLCPVGTTLGLVSRYSIFHIDINTDRCIQCRKCEHACKASCINMIDHVVDSSRCVVCFDCLQECPNDAIHYTPSSHRLSLPMLQRLATPKAKPRTAATDSATDSATAGTPRLVDRRNFMATGVIAALAIPVLKVDGAIRTAAATATGAIKPAHAHPVYPPGVPDLATFLRHCTGCGLCVSHCPQRIMRPTTTHYQGRITNALRPMLDFELGSCDFDCTLCNNLCPTKALTKLTLQEKQRTPIGRAEVITRNCIGCGNCAAACPRNAIEMAGNSEDQWTPVINPALCIGCGACQNACPAYPYVAIYVNGLS